MRRRIRNSKDRDEEEGTGRRISSPLHSLITTIDWLHGQSGTCHIEIHH